MQETWERLDEIASRIVAGLAREQVKSNRVGIVRAELVQAPLYGYGCVMGTFSVANENLVAGDVGEESHAPCRSAALGGGNARWKL